MNRKETLAAIRAIPHMNASYDTDAREYRVIVKGLTPNATERGAYYTDDPLDAVGTAKAMSAHHANKLASAAARAARKAA